MANKKTTDEPEKDEKKKKIRSNKLTTARLEMQEKTKEMYGNPSWKDK